MGGSVERRGSGASDGITPQSPVDPKTEGQMPATSSGKRHKIDWLKDKLGGAKESIRTTIRPLGERISNVFSKKSEEPVSAKTHIEENQPSRFVPEKALTPPPSLDTPPPVPRRDDAFGLELPSTLTETWKMLNEKRQEKADLSSRIIETKSTSSGPASQRLVSDLEDKLARVEGEIRALQEHLETFEAHPAPESVELPPRFNKPFVTKIEKGFEEVHEEVQVQELSAPPPNRPPPPAPQTRRPMPPPPAQKDPGPAPPRPPRRDLGEH